ncbi:MAG: GNAT family N-acetyltransferase [Bdellovibrionales bacterium]
MIKEICLEDAEQVYSSYFKEALKESGLRSFSFSKASKALVFEKEGEEAALASILIYREITPKIIEIDFIATRAAFRRQGIAQALVDFLEAEELWLELKEANDKALSFYEKNGFTVTGRRDNYYSDGSAALNMLRK